MALDSSGILSFLAMASTSMGAAPTIASPSLKAMTGYCGWPVAVILAQSAAAAAVLANAKAANTLKQRNLFMVKILVLTIGVGRCRAGPADAAVRGELFYRPSCALILFTSAWEIFPA